MMYHLEKSCHVQMMVLSGGLPYTVPSPEMCERVARQFTNSGRAQGTREWPALFRLAERLDPSFKT